MGYQDRPYFQDRSDARFNPLSWILYGSVPLFTAFGIRVRAHATLVLTVVLVLAFGSGKGFGWQDRVGSMTALFAIVLLHEFGHCFTARWVGGDAEDILMHPLGGFAFARPPHRPWPTFLTVAGGPAVNVVICILCGAVLWATAGRLPANPFIPTPFVQFTGWLDVRWLAYWIYETSYMLLVFNLMPIYPLDGGQMLQAALWKPLGYYKSMMFSCITGMVAAVLGAMVALATANWGLAILASMGFYSCFSMRRQLIAMGAEEYADTTDYSAAYEIEPPRKRTNKRAAARIQKLARQEAAERIRIDAILEKVSQQGMHSLNWWEKRDLRKATEHQRRRDAEVARGRRF